MLRKICAWSAIAAATAIGSNVSAQTPAPATDTQVVAYVSRAEPPKFEYWRATPYFTNFRTKNAGREMVEADGIPNFADETAREIAKAYASAHGLALASAPIIVDANHPLPGPTSHAAFPGARYVVDAETPGMALDEESSLIPPSDPKTYLVYSERVQILDGETGQVVAKASCQQGYNSSMFAGGLPRRTEVLADKGAGLKRLMREKAEICISILKAHLGL